MTRELQVEAGASSYKVSIGTGLLGDPGSYPLEQGATAAIVADSNVRGHYAGKVAKALEQLEVRAHVIEVPAGEASKSWEQLRQLCEQLADLRLDRRGWVLTLGGGMTGDLGGCAAALYLRGLRFIQLPTTLLAMVDASIGGKTAINIAAGKNLIGAFHQPQAVVADIDTLATLDEREYRAGLAEVVKHAVLDAGVMGFLAGSAEGLAAGQPRDAELLEELVAINAAFKAGIVASDEREKGVRAHLNLGHTFAHAIEAATGYGELLHGEAVAMGLVAACRLSARLGHASAALEQQVAGLLATLGLPTAFPRLRAEQLLEPMLHDKKVAAGRISFVLAREVGEVLVSSDVEEEVIRQVIEEMMA